MPGTRQRMPGIATGSQAPAAMTAALPMEAPSPGGRWSIKLTRWPSRCR